jgi:hypothetical protein
MNKRKSYFSQDVVVVAFFFYHAVTKIRLDNTRVKYKYFLILLVME